MLEGGRVRLVPHDPLRELRGDTGTREVRPQRRAQRVQVDRPALVVGDVDPGHRAKGRAPVSLADHDGLAVRVRHDHPAAYPTGHQSVPWWPFIGRADGYILDHVHPGIGALIRAATAIGKDVNGLGDMESDSVVPILSQRNSDGQTGHPNLNIGTVFDYHIHSYIENANLPGENSSTEIAEAIGERLSRPADVWHREGLDK